MESKELGDSEAICISDATTDNANNMGPLTQEGIEDLA